MVKFFIIEKNTSVIGEAICYIQNNTDERNALEHIIKKSHSLTVF